jgi:hypothetical protein
MNTKRLLEIVKDRGLQVVLRDGRPIIVQGKKKENVTSELLAVLAAHREKIIKLLSETQ